MKQHHRAKPQKGFFDLGFSLAILALAGAFTWAATPGEDDRSARQDLEIEVVADVESRRHQAL